MGIWRFSREDVRTLSALAFVEQKVGEKHEIYLMVPQCETASRHARSSTPGAKRVMPGKEVDEPRAMNL